MAFSSSFEKVKSEHNPNYWTIDEFEAYYLQNLSERSEHTHYYTDRNGVERRIPPTNHHPNLKEYEVWCEGCSDTGEHGTAQLMGKAMARCFAQACHIVMCQLHLDWIWKENQPDYDKYSALGRWDYDPARLTYWGCRLHWSEEVARKTYG